MFYPFILSHVHHDSCGVLIHSFLIQFHLQDWFKSMVGSGSGTGLEVEWLYSGWVCDSATTSIPYISLRKSSVDMLVSQEATLHSTKIILVHQKCEIIFVLSIIDFSLWLPVKLYLLIFSASILI